jgi:hypothetical protein
LRYAADEVLCCSLALGRCWLSHFDQGLQGRGMCAVAQCRRVQCSPVRPAVRILGNPTWGWQGGICSTTRQFLFPVPHFPTARVVGFGFFGPGWVPDTAWLAGPGGSGLAAGSGAAGCFLPGAQGALKATRSSPTPTRFHTRSGGFVFYSGGRSQINLRVYSLHVPRVDFYSQFI